MAADVAAPPRSTDRPWRRRLRPVVGFLSVMVILLVAWEALKAIGGDRWQVESFLGTGISIDWQPPFVFAFATDVKLPHTWVIALEFAATDANGMTTLQRLVGAALFTLRNAAIGFALGTLLGLGLAILLVHVRMLERSLVPIIVASQTIPIIALAPMIVFALGANVTSVVVIATYLTFFPVTIAMIRGLRAFDPRAMELMRSYAASRRQVYWKLRLPASLPFLFVALKIAATASIVGAIIGEGPGGMNDGLGLVILTYNQYYITGPEKLWAAIVATGLLGIAFYLLISLAEHFVLRGRSRLTLG